MKIPSFMVVAQADSLLLCEDGERPHDDDETRTAATRSLRRERGQTKGRSTQRRDAKRPTTPTGTSTSKATQCKGSQKKGA